MLNTSYIPVYYLYQEGNMFVFFHEQIFGVVIEM